MAVNVSCLYVTTILLGHLCIIPFYSLIGEDIGKMEVDVPIDGIEGILNQIMADGNDAVTPTAFINGQ